ncbi:MAG: tetratricopeptide repeat protein, partial [Bacteroidetes bacterium]|nr:tetratricopeptide repeat protein [Bacteroidota bacterium]
MKRHFLFLIIISISCFARQSKVDSLLILLQKEKEDTAKINCLNDLSRELLNKGDYDPAMKYANDALTICDRLLSINRPEYSGSILNLKRATAYNNIGIIYKNQSNFDKALENYFTALKIREEVGDKQGIAYSYNNIGIIFYEQNNYAKALENYFASLKIREEIGDKKGIAASYNNIGNIYAEQASLASSDSATYQEQLYGKALKNYFASLKIKEEIGDKNGMAYSYNNIGSIYYEQAELERNSEKKEQLHAKALENYFTSMRIREAIGDKNGIAACYINIGTFYTSLKQFSNANEYLNKGLCLSREIGSKNYIKESYRGLSDLYSAQGNWKEAYQNHKLFSEVKDSILNEESSKQIAEMQTKYETEKKEQQITLLNKDKELQDAQLNRQKIIIWSVAGGLLVVLILSVFIFRERRKSEKLLLNILPAETARELKAKGKASAKHYESVTVMFTDFKGFTTIAEKLSAEELVSELDFLFKKFDEIISKYNIEKIKTIG